MTCLASQGWYPWVICHAVALVDDLPEFQSLPDSYGQVLRRLIKKVGKNDGQQAIFARRQTLAAEAGKSIETVYRALREFERRGWIEVREKKAGEGLMGSSSEIVFSRGMCDLLDLPYEGKPRRKVVERSAVEEPSVSGDTSSNVIVVSLLQPSTKGHPDRVSHECEKLSTPAGKKAIGEDGCGVVRIDGKSVPNELAWLVVRQGLSLTGLFALMKQAREQGKLLSDVVECVRQHLGKLNGRSLFGYLSSLIYLERDFAWEVKQKGEKFKAIRDDQESRRRLQDATNKLSGLWFRSVKSGSVFEVDRGGWVRMFSVDERGQVREGSKPIEIAFVDAIDAGALIQCEAGTAPIWMREMDWGRLVA